MKLSLTSKILAVELAGDDIRATLVHRKARRLEVMDFAAMKRPDPQDDLPAVEALKALANRLGYAGGPVVLVTPLARAFELLMDRRKVAGMKHYQLLEAVRWEVEPYTGISGTSALVGVEPERKVEPLPGEIVPEVDTDQVTITVAAIERNVYRAARERCKVAGLQLVRIYPPEETFYYALLLDEIETPRALLEVGPDYSNFAILRGGTPEQISTLSLSLDSLSAHLAGEQVSNELEDNLRFTVRQAPDGEPLVISGQGAADAAVVAFIAGFCPGGARPLTLSRAAGVADAPEEAAHAVFGTAVGAAIRELKGRKARQAGIDDKVPLIPRLKRSVYIVPLATAAVLVLLLTGHYQFMRFQEKRYKARIVSLNEEAKNRKTEVEKYEKLLAESNALQKEIDETKKRLAYIGGKADQNLTQLITCLQGLAAALPERIVLQSVSQGGPTVYKVSGSAFALEAVGAFATKLQETPWCEAAVIDKLETGSGKEGLAFDLTVNAGGEGA
ncbi:PilN domain-containing protein [uncultured Desulfosarcina sp.]|uniref:PilN domain-containing protein n=1 Tax=uncultured Desulfosarcina sp. TaxID=218289 RepID=UPI0029C8BC94|nr:PilN domain-containing protein [uncultured Desulfosarcina sp.]